MAERRFQAVRAALIYPHGTKMRRAFERCGVLVPGAKRRALGADHPVAIGQAGQPLDDVMTVFGVVVQKLELAL